MDSPIANHDLCFKNAAISENIATISLRGMCTNARSLCNKITELNHILYTNNICFASITETWLVNHILNSMILPVKDFTIFRSDRVVGGDCTRGGGSCLIIKNLSSLSCCQVTVPIKFSAIEIVCRCIHQ